ncbi:hypothetical protein DSO57_1007207 [Entomophthora muscae]|uniref:Uncharacterized protein n=1 Tax=Entomophthora muscae TaxID=34485 RepID=A0ACC2TII0_9FUNG|nr:hypothetical protein DSO57_1007207 [Entomophthora muscae]
MNYIICTAVLKAYLGIRGNQPTYTQFGPEPQGPKWILYNEPTHLSSIELNPWTPLASSRLTPNLAKYMIPTVTLLHLSSSLGQCNFLAKAFCQAINLYSIVYALNGFEPSDLGLQPKFSYKDHANPPNRIRIYPKFLAVVSVALWCPLLGASRGRSAD